MKKVTFLIVLLIPIMILAQNVAINNDGSLPDSNALLDLKSSSKGLLIPRLTTLERTSIAGPAIGLTVFDKETFSYWMYRGDINGGWAEMLHTYQNNWAVSGNNLYNTNNGNLGIGTSNPTEKLTINATNPVLKFLNAGVEKGFIQINGSDTKFGTYASNTIGDLVLSTKGIDRMHISPDGNFGIGVSNPAAKFQILAGSEATYSTHGFLMLGNENATNLIFDNNEILARNNGNAANLYLQDGGGNVYIGDPVNFSTAHRLGVDGNAVITGNVRIGATPSPSGYKLAVDGKAICTELLVRLVTNWPDYVFHKDYSLPGLQEVEDFINKNNHLPGIPSAETIELNGLSVGEMQKMQMKKIEELTLYIIDLKKDIETLKRKK